MTTIHASRPCGGVTATGSACTRRIADNRPTCGFCGGLRRSTAGVTATRIATEALADTSAPTRQFTERQADSYRRSGVDPAAADPYDVRFANEAVLGMLRDGVDAETANAYGSRWSGVDVYWLGTTGVPTEAAELWHPDFGGHDIVQLQAAGLDHHSSVDWVGVDGDLAAESMAGGIEPAEVRRRLSGARTAIAAFIRSAESADNDELVDSGVDEAQFADDLSTAREMAAQLAGGWRFHDQRDILVFASLTGNRGNA